MNSEKSNIAIKSDDIKTVLNTYVLKGIYVLNAAMNSHVDNNLAVDYCEHMTFTPDQMGSQAAELESQKIKQINYNTLYSYREYVDSLAAKAKKADIKLPSAAANKKRSTGKKLPFTMNTKFLNVLSDVLSQFMTHALHTHYNDYLNKHCSKHVERNNAVTYETYLSDLQAANDNLLVVTGLAKRFKNMCSNMGRWNEYVDNISNPEQDNKLHAKMNQIIQKNQKFNQNDSVYVTTIVSNMMKMIGWTLAVKFVTGRKQFNEKIGFEILCDAGYDWSRAKEVINPLPSYGNEKKRSTTPKKPNSKKVIIETPAKDEGEDEEVEAGNHVAEDSDDDGDAAEEPEDEEDNE